MSDEPICNCHTSLYYHPVTRRRINVNCEIHGPETVGVMLVRSLPELVEFEPTDEQIERAARLIFARSKEGRDGFTWPINGDWGRQRDLEDARRFLVYAIGPRTPDTEPVEPKR